MDEYRDDKGHFTSKDNNGGECHHDHKINSKLSKSGKSVYLDFANKPIPVDLYEEYKDEFEKFINNEKLNIDDVKRLVEKPLKYNSYNGIVYDTLLDMWENANSKKEVDDFKHKYNFDLFDNKIKENNSFDNKQKDNQEELQYKNRIKKLSDDEIINKLNDFKLYTNTRKENTDGGYSGHSKSNRAVNAENNNQFPLSKWNKNHIQNLYENLYIEFSEDEDINKYIMEEINNLSDKEIKDNLLDKVSWHHTGAFATPTNYYGLKSPKEIYDYIKSKNKKGAENIYGIKFIK